MKIIRMVVGSCDTNCYLAINEETEEGFLVDPGDSAKELSEMVLSEGVHLKAILLTHGHFDHILAVDELREEFAVPVLIGVNEKKIVTDVHNNLSDTTDEELTVEADLYVYDGAELEIAGMKMNVIENIGHTCGAVSYYFEDEKVIFTGDTLMCESYGITHFPTGDYDTLRGSINAKLLVLPEETMLLGGHLEPSTIGHERKFNPISDFA